MFTCTLPQHPIELKIFPNVSAHLKLHYFSHPDLQWPKSYGLILGTKVQQTDERTISHVIAITSTTMKKNLAVGLHSISIIK